MLIGSRSYLIKSVYIGWGFLTLCLSSSLGLAAGEPLFPMPTTLSEGGEARILSMRSGEVPVQVSRASLLSNFQKARFQAELDMVWEELKAIKAAYLAKADQETLSGLLNDIRQQVNLLQEAERRINVFVIPTKNRDPNTWKIYEGELKRLSIECRKVRAPIGKLRSWRLDESKISSLELGIFRIQQQYALVQYMVIALAKEDLAFFVDTRLLAAAGKLTYKISNNDIQRHYAMIQRLDKIAVKDISGDIEDPPSLRNLVCAGTFGHEEEIPAASSPDLEGDGPLK